MSKIYDVFLFNDELDLLEARLNYLSDIVDYFVITEVDTTFSGSPKPFHFLRNVTRFEQFSSKIIHNPVRLEKILERRFWSSYGYTDFSESYSHKHKGKVPASLHKTQINEILQRDACIDALALCDDRDWVLISDVDEFPSHSALNSLISSCDDSLFYFKQDWRVYWLNNFIDKPWFGTVATRYKTLKLRSVDSFRLGASDCELVPGRRMPDGGWQLRYMGGASVIKKKLNDLAYQGIRAEVTKVLTNIIPFYLNYRLSRGDDILNQGRVFVKKPLEGLDLSIFPKNFLELNLK